MFTTISLRRLASAEFLQFIKLLVNLLDKAGVDALKLKKVRDRLAFFLPELTLALNAEIASEETKIMENEDLKRDRAIIGLTFLIRGNTYHEDENIQKAANLLLSFLKAQGNNIARLNYQAETPILRKIAESFQNEDSYKQAVATLGLTSWVLNMEKANNAFETVFLNRSSKESKLSTSKPFGKLKLDVLEVYYDALDVIKSRYRSAKEDEQPTEGYEKLISEINTLIKKYKAYIPNDEDDDDTPPTA